MTKLGRIKTEIESGLGEKQKLEMKNEHMNINEDKRLGVLNNRIKYVKLKIKVNRISRSKAIKVKDIKVYC